MTLKVSELELFMVFLSYEEVKSSLIETQWNDTEFWSIRKVLLAFTHQVFFQSERNTDSACWNPFSSYWQKLILPTKVFRFWISYKDHEYAVGFDFDYSNKVVSSEFKVYEYPLVPHFCEINSKFNIFWTIFF